MIRGVLSHDFVGNIYHPLTIGLVAGAIAGVLSERHNTVGALVAVGVFYGLAYLGGLVVAAALPMIRGVLSHDFVGNIYNPLTIGLVAGAIAGVLSERHGTVGALVAVGAFFGIAYLGGLVVAAVLEWKEG